MDVMRNDCNVLGRELKLEYIRSFFSVSRRRKLGKKGKQRSSHDQLRKSRDDSQTEIFET